MFRTPIFPKDNLVLPILILLSSMACYGPLPGGDSLASSLSPASPALNLLTRSLSSATAGNSYASPLLADGGTLPYSWKISAGSLPAGFTLDAKTGLLSGIAVGSGTFAFEASVADSRDDSSSASLSLIVLPTSQGGTPPPPPAPVSVVTQTLPPATVDTPYRAAFAATGGVPPYFWQLSGALPAGFLLDAGTGILSGTTYQNGTFALQAEVLDAGGGTAQASLSLIVAAAATTDGDDLDCPNGYPTWGVSDGPAFLPENCMNTSMANSPASGPVVNVSSSDELTVAMATAVCGEKITLTAGNAFVGHFMPAPLPCPANNWLIVRTSEVESLPAEGARYSTTYQGWNISLPQFGPCYAGVASLPGRPAFHCPKTPGTYTAQLITPDSAPPLSLQAGSTNFRFLGLEVTRTPGTGIVGVLANIGNVGNIDHIVFDRDWIHGDESGGKNGDETVTAVNATRTAYVASIDSYFCDIYCVSGIGACTDSHVFVTGNNNTDTTAEEVLKIDNNYIEAAGENVLFGGAAALVSPRDSQISRNALVKPRIWNQADPTYNGGVGGHALEVKNLFEIKNADRVLFEQNVLFNVWGGFSQNGGAFAIGAKNQGGQGGTNLCPACSATNITIRDSIVNSANYFGSFSLNANGNGAVAAAQNNISVHDVVADNLGYGTCNACTNNSGTLGISEDYLAIASAGQIYHDASFRHLTLVSASGAPLKLAALNLTGMPLPSSFGMYNITFADNVLLAQQYGTFNAAGGGAANCAFAHSGESMIENCWQTFTFGGNCWIGNGSTVWPGTNAFADTQAAAFVNWNNGIGGDYTIAPGPCKGAGTDGKDPGADLIRLSRFWRPAVQR